MQLPDENIEYQFQRLLVPLYESWTPLAELQNQHYLPPEKLEKLRDEAIKTRGLVVAERELLNPPPKLRPLQAGFIDLPQKLLDQFKRKQDASELGKVFRISNRLREEVDRVVVLGIGGSYLGAKALFDALCHTYHNEMPANLRMGKPRVYFEGNNVDNDSLQELFELLENACVDPVRREEVLALEFGQRRPRLGRLSEQPLVAVLDVLVGQLHQVIPVQGRRELDARIGQSYLTVRHFRRGVNSRV